MRVQKSIATVKSNICIYLPPCSSTPLVTLAGDFHTHDPLYPCGWVGWGLPLSMVAGIIVAFYCLYNEGHWYFWDRDLTGAVIAYRLFFVRDDSNWCDDLQKSTYV
jgi:hypothetical protein